MDKIKIDDCHAITKLKITALKINETESDAT